MNASLNTWTSIFLIAAGQGVFLSFFLFRKHRLNSGNLYLATAILLFSLMLSFYVAYWTGFVVRLPRILWASLAFTYLIGPLILFYLRSYRGAKLTARDTLHFLPFFAHVGIVLSVRENEFMAIVQTIHVVIYAALIVQYSRTFKRNHEWLKKLAVSYALYSASFLAYYVMVWTGILKVEYDYMVSFLMAFFLYYIGYQSFSKPEVLRADTRKYQNAGLTDGAYTALRAKVLDHFEVNKPYHNGDYKLTDLAREIEIPKHHLSQMINKEFEMNFPEFVNQYRIKEAKDILRSSDRKIIDVAFSTGFNNKITFLQCFKKLQGQTPTEYRNSYQNKIADIA